MMGKLMSKDGEIIEVILTQSEIENLIKKLNIVKEDKNHIHFNIDGDNELMISHEDCELNKYYERDVVSEIRKLSKEKIDDLFYACEWIDENKGKNKALFDEKIREIKKGDSKLIDSFIQETGIEKIKRELERLK